MWLAGHHRAPWSDVCWVLGLWLIVTPWDGEYINLLVTVSRLHAPWMCTIHFTFKIFDKKYKLLKTEDKRKQSCRWPWDMLVLCGLTQTRIAERLDQAVKDRTNWTNFLKFQGIQMDWRFCFFWGGVSFSSGWPQTHYIGMNRCEHHPRLQLWLFLCCLFLFYLVFLRQGSGTLSIAQASLKLRENCLALPLESWACTTAAQLSCDF